MKKLTRLLEEADFARSSFAQAVDAMEPGIKELFKKLKTDSIKLPFPVCYAGPDYSDSYVRLILDEHGELQAEDSAGVTDVGDLNEGMLFAIYSQVINNYTK